MTPQDVKEYYGNGYNFHDVTGMARSSYNNWGRCKFIPFLSQKKIERLTKGKLKAVWDDVEIENSVSVQR